MKRLLDIHKLYRDFSLPLPPEKDKHRTQGWVQTHCPFCSSQGQGYHLGYNEATGHFNCWRCGWHPQLETIQELLNLSKKNALDVLSEYSGRPVRLTPAEETASHRPSTSLPTGTGPMDARHKAYLEKRKFDPDKLEEVWDLKGTGPVGPYKNRVIAPIYLRGRLVSYQGRDITGLAPQKYKACASQDESVAHKSTLYGIDLVPGKTVVVVEGIADAWRLGPGAVATFGASMSTAQMSLIIKRFTRVFMFWDADEAGSKMLKVQAQLGLLTGQDVSCIVGQDTDAGDMAQDDADALMRDVMTTLL